MNELVDTNFLVRLRQPGTPVCQTCESALQELLRRGDTLYLCAQVAVEFWSVATRPIQVNGLGLSPAEAEIALCDAEQWIVWLPEPPDIGARWRVLVNRYKVAGR